MAKCVEINEGKRLETKEWKKLCKFYIIEKELILGLVKVNSHTFSQCD